MTITLDDRDYKIKLSGTIEDPYFCGRDVCEILGYKDLKDAMKKFVDKEDKINLFDLNEKIMVNLNHTLGGALYPPPTVWLRLTMF